MVQVTFLQPDGTSRMIIAALDQPLMFPARNAGVKGIVAECGGSAMCATCHCYVLATPNGPLPAPLADEADTIEFNAHEPRENSRLTCQIKVTAALEGAVLQVATGR